MWRRRMRAREIPYTPVDALSSLLCNSNKEELRARDGMRKNSEHMYVNVCWQCIVLFCFFVDTWNFISIITIGRGGFLHDAVVHAQVSNMHMMCNWYELPIGHSWTKGPQWLHAQVKRLHGIWSDYSIQNWIKPTWSRRHVLSVVFHCEKKSCMCHRMTWFHHTGSARSKVSTGQ